MPYLYDYNQSDYGTLLAANVLDASKGALFDTVGLKPDTTNRTILIGMGGTGVRTIDYVKGAISKQLRADWERYVAFLGIDSSASEFRSTSYLTLNEQVNTTREGVAERMSTPEKYPDAVRRHLPEGTQLGGLDSNGSGRTRLVGKVKLHDKATGNLGVDEEIVSKLANMRSSILDPLAPNTSGTYQVYVIGSVCGGTCSGSFLEMPALIRKALPARCKINAMLYLPDTLTSLDPQNKSALYSNGYAALKELNYYMGMYMRPDYPETWSYNDKAYKELTYSSSIGRESFFDVPYLVGTANGDAADASKVAMETIAEFLISTLAEISVAGEAQFLTSAFESNATAAPKVGGKEKAPGNDQREAAGEFHEFPKRFAAIGFAEASAPQRLVRAYTVGKVCELAGIMPVTPDERNSRKAAGGHLVIPFRGTDDLMNATEGTQKARELAQPLANIFSIIFSGDFNFGQDFQEKDVTWRKIRNGEYDNSGLKMRGDKLVEQRTNSATIDRLRSQIITKFDEYRRGVQNFVREEGPLAFVNLYNGRFIPVNHDAGMGLGKMIENIMDGKHADGSPARFLTPEDAKKMLDHARATIANTSLVSVFSHGEQAAQWVTAYNNWMKARINDVRKDVALGVHGAIHDSFLTPAATLTREVEAFGIILESLGGIYRNHGSDMLSFREFSSAQDKKTEVNLAAVNTASYEWLKHQADTTLANVNAQELRAKLVDHFFAMGEDNIPNSRKWLQIPENCVTSGSNGEVQLQVPDVAIPARECFDTFMAENFPVVLDVSIETMFTELAASGQNFDRTAEDVMGQLFVRSKPQFDGDIPANSMFMYVMYPSALKRGVGNGPAIATAIERAARTVAGNTGVAVYASDDADSIMFYQMAAPMEIYRLRALANWEKEYEIQDATAFLHGMSPDLKVTYAAGEKDVYTELTTWKDYPPITGQLDPTKRDPLTGQISREGKLRLKLRDLMKQAKEQGVLYSVNTAAGWIVKRIHLDKSRDWGFDLMECTPNPTTGLLPTGKALVEAVVSQNQATVEQLSRKVSLEWGGLMNEAHATEALAWEFAERTLRSHVPMYIEVRDTLERFQVWEQMVAGPNAEVLSRFLPAYMVWMVKGCIVRRNEDGTWVYMDEAGKPKVLAALTPVMMKFMPPKDKYYIENGLLSYYLFSKLEKVLPTQKDFEVAFNRARDNITQLVADSEIDALTAAEETAAQLISEVAQLQEKGARLDGDPETTVRSQMSASFPGIKDPAILKEIDLFYFRMGLWEEI